MPTISTVTTLLPLIFVTVFLGVGEAAQPEAELKAHLISTQGYQAT